MEQQIVARSEKPNDPILSEEAAVELIHKLLEENGIYPVGHGNRGWPESLYFGSWRSDLFQIRVSNHPKPYTSKKFEVSIIIKGEMEEARIRAMVQEAMTGLKNAQDASGID